MSQNQPSANSRKTPAPSENFGRKSPLRPIVPGWVFSCNLPAAAIAVWAYLWHCTRAKDRCYPSVKKIAKACRLHKDTVGNALNLLEEAGLIARRRTGRANDYFPVIPNNENKGDQIPENKGDQIPGKRGDQIPGKRGDKGYRRKEPGNTAVSYSSISGCENEREVGTARGAQNPGAEAPDSDPSRTADQTGANLEPDYCWEDFITSDDGPEGERLTCMTWAEMSATDRRWILERVEPRRRAAA